MLRTFPIGDCYVSVRALGPFSHWGVLCLSLCLGHIPLGPVVFLSVLGTFPIRSLCLGHFPLDLLCSSLCLGHFPLDLLCSSLRSRTFPIRSVVFLAVFRTFPVGGCSASLCS